MQTGERRRACISWVVGIALLVAVIVVSSDLGSEKPVSLASHVGGGLKQLLREALKEEGADAKLAKGKTRSEDDDAKVKAEARQEELSDCSPYCGDSGAHGSQDEALASTSHHKSESASKVQQLAKAEEKTDCEPFCADAGAVPDRSAHKHAREGLHVKVSGSGKDIAPVDGSSKTEMSVEDKRKIHDAALRIAKVMSNSQGVSSDVKREMAEIKKSGTSWNALWGSSTGSLSGRGAARFDYLASAADAGGHSGGSNPLGGSFHY